MARLSSKRTPDDDPIALLDTSTNTWITDFVPQSMSLPDASDSDEETSTTGSLSTGAALGIAFLHAPRAAIGRQAAVSQSSGLFHRAALLFGLGAGSRRGKARGGKGSTTREKGIRPEYWRHSADSSSSTHSSSQQPRTLRIAARLNQMGLSLATLGYPEDVVQQGTGQVPMSSYAYPNQACAETEKARGGHETLIVFHDLAPAQKEHVKQERLLRQQQEQQLQQQQQQQQQQQHQHQHQHQQQQQLQQQQQPEQQQQQLQQLQQRRHELPIASSFVNTQYDPYRDE
ncbi:hypothetical protein BGZ70_007517 [Mortierella alpina]|uniref:Uncharacterized protein n=1 Tax=Mortierella alpina TaxID=64518 RepID=A0A9P6J7W7_MORAP|nr:hypothetical protein BGZ70_007517 [Mortierella alpina]